MFEGRREIGPVDPSLLADQDAPDIWATGTAGAADRLRPPTVDARAVDDLKFADARQLAVPHRFVRFRA